MRVLRSLLTYGVRLILCLILTCFFPTSEVTSQNRHGLPPGPETEAFFTRVQKRKQQLPAVPPSLENPFSLADLNKDGKCDGRDVKLFRKVLGKCVRVGSSAVVSEADYDMDGCVTKKDKQSFQDLWHSCRLK